MTNAPTDAPIRRSFSLRLLYGLSLAMVVIGLINATPGIPGYDALIGRLSGQDSFQLRKFPSEWFYPLFFALMMIVVVLRHSMWRDWQDRSYARRRFGLALDSAMVVMALTIAVTYMIEIESICLIDRINGDRDRLIAESLKAAAEFNAQFGLPAPTTVEDPQCVNTTGGWLVLIVGLAVVVFLSYNVKVWGLPLVIVAILISAYTILTVLVWYFYGADDINKYLVTKLAGEPRMLSDGRPRVHDVLVNNASGLLGRFMEIVLNTIFPYLVLGSLFGSSAGGRSLIKLAFRWTRHLRGGPAHAAIVSSAMFGTISGGPIVNVLSTGVLTIPMMIKRGFSKVFAGGVEAAASSGGSIMPPVMGVAAFVLASLTSVPYSSVIVAAIIPAMAYFFCLFLSAVFQSRKQNITAIGEITDDMILDRQDYLNLVMVFGPILLILTLLLIPKDAVGCGVLGGVLGADRVITDTGCSVQSLSWVLQAVQNSAGSAGAAGWWAVMLLMVLLFLDPEVRQRPRKIVDAMSDAGVLIATLYLMFLAVSIIDFCLSFTGLPVFLSLDVLAWLNGMNLGGGGSYFFQMIALLMTMFLAVLLGMGMPAVPAYINAALLMSPVLAGLGLSLFTAHMFIFYFAVASAITPPVALAAFAAASITRAEPMATGFSAVKSGIVMFVVPFVFAFYPELLLIDEALIDPQSAGGTAYLAGYDGERAFGALVLLLVRLIVALYLLSSALAGFDRRPLAFWEIALRLGLAVLIMMRPEALWIGAAVATLVTVALHRRAARTA
ncbi:TRAP transporter fused permease subunit [Cognatishimia sp. F0-27]|uniref:TRAP transporter permease n=1 Tax=Cognatishimia sp. F0-27 TaxID=2816855 RepID=UPI001D0CC7A4|nr:TRAP transporter fused permease subunit [Cognatishimia sp. F0-27]MCC1494326.1 TRAP transporter fused permease subunit [Cognatishimia sp. F0-27]